MPECALCDHLEASHGIDGCLAPDDEGYACGCPFEPLPDEEPEPERYEEAHRGA